MQKSFIFCENVVSLQSEVEYIADFNASNPSQMIDLSNYIYTPCSEIIANENNISSFAFKKQDNLPQLSFNKGDKCSLILEGEEDLQKVERTYVVVGKIEKLNNIEINAIIVKQIGGDDTTIFSLTKSDCKELGIKYMHGLQLFPSNMNWKSLKSDNNIIQKFEEYCTEREKNDTLLKSALYNLYYSDFFYLSGGNALEICTANSVITATNYNGLTIDSVIIKVDGFHTHNDDSIIDSYGHIINTYDFLSTLKVLTKNDIIEYDNCASFNANESLPFRVVSVRHFSDRTVICDDKNNCIQIEIYLTRPCRIQGQTITGYIGISIDNNILKDNFIVTWLYSENNNEYKEENIDLYWQFAEINDLLDKNNYFNF